ncbi:hypothetical protein GCM10027275_19780 [Rhabdobacter roseus]|uniref:Outer membrane protein OmpA-like peptidoglycan-associated protein n=1 Tax=Rhabdobacter roseus TaxID=1655419 RepID=A0A840TKG8_9BACT|nr:OmpA family protein [Rhabdobacter roseus]MBB5283904.1 outer membrane protein OmpA-like peptidoglycan-associated protein [Rhabdobacter roseus]
MRKRVQIAVCTVLSLFAGSVAWAQGSPTTTTRLTLNAVDELSGQELVADFEAYLHKAGQRYQGTSQPGSTPFSFLIIESDTVTIHTSSAGYFSMEEIVLVLCDTCGFYAYTARLEKQVDSVYSELKVHDVIQLDKIYFDQSSYYLRPESREELEKVYRTLRDHPRLKVEVAGHTDNVGDARLNLLLSENRARVIYYDLLRKNIAPDRLRFRGYGHTKPRAPNDSEENKAKNRRVELVILEN